MADSGEMMDIGFNADDSTEGEKEDDGINELPKADARDDVEKVESVGTVMLRSKAGGPPEAVQRVLVINVCNDVHYSVSVDTLNPENIYTRFCFGPHVLSFCTKDAIPLVIYNNNDNQTLSLDDVTLANVLSTDPCPMTGPLFYRKSKAEFKELTENETVHFMIQSTESCSRGESRVEEMEVDAAVDPPSAAEAEEGSAGPGNELIGNDEIMNYLRSKDMTGLLSLDSNEFHLIESTLSTEQAIDILGPGVMNLYGESSHVHAPAASAPRVETDDSPSLSAKEFVEFVLKDHSYATPISPHVELPAVMSPHADLPASPVQAVAAAFILPGSPTSPQKIAAGSPHRFATLPFRSGLSWSQASTVKRPSLGEGECGDEEPKQIEPEEVPSQPSPTSSLHLGSDSLELTQKQRAKGWVGGLPSPTAQLSGNGSPLVLKANGRPRQKLTEAMIDEKLSQELPDNDDYKFSSEDASKEDPFEEDCLSKWVGASPPDNKISYSRSPSRVTEKNVKIAQQEKKRKRPRVASLPQQQKGLEEFEDECSPKKSTKAAKLPAKPPPPARRAADAKKTRKPSGAAKVAELKVETVAKENAAAPGKDGKAAPPLGATKSYPKRENRRPPGRLQDALQPALFSAPDVIRRYSTEAKPVAQAGLTDECIEKMLNESEDSDGNGTSVEPSDGLQSQPTSQTTSQPTSQTTSQPVSLSSSQTLTWSLSKSTSSQVSSEPASQSPPTHVRPIEGEFKTEVMDVEARPASPEVKVSKRIRKKKQIFTELEDPKPTPRVQKGKPKPTDKVPNSKGGRAGLGARGKEKKVEEDPEADSESDSGSVNSEDDPNKLWCVCRKPHNNRFMICCDRCGEWFHGLCVNIPRALGKAIEKAGNEWTCPGCVERIEKEGPPITKEASKVPAKKSTPAAVSSGKKSPIKRTQNLLGALTSKKSKVSPKSKPQKTSPAKIMQCILCENPARPNSIYCSDICILKHAGDSQSAQPSAETAVKATSPEKKQSPVATPIAKETDAKHSPIKSSTASLKKSTPKILLKRPGELNFKSKMVPINKKLLQPSMQPASKPKTTPQELKKGAGGSSKVHSEPKSPTKAPVKVVKKVVVKSRPSLETTKLESAVKTEAEKSMGSEPVRVNVRETLHSLLLARLKECDDLKTIPDEEVKKIGYSIEEELYALFKETGSKYKSKYRSLVFNIRDPTNLTLFRKIAEKLVTPKQLVRLTPEELASQQLALWREQESKHQLEMIKKNELDLMALSKTVVMKTHKGEQIIESDDVHKETVLDFGIDNTDSLNQSSVTSTVPDAILVSHKSSSSSKKSSSKSSSSHSYKKKSSKDRKKESHSSHKEKDSSRHREKSRHRSTSHHSRESKSSHSSHSSRSKDTPAVKIEEKVKLEEVKEDKDAIPLIPASSQEAAPDETTDVSVVSTEPSVKVEETSADREPSSTVPDVNSCLEPESPPGGGSSPVPGTLWTGCVYMPDIVKFVGSVHMVSGNFPKGCYDFPATLDIVGRIPPGQVWPYISKMKRSGTKEISVIRFSPVDEDETTRYMLLHTYLNSRNRLGVAGNLPKTIKDLYVLPLPPHTPLPQVLLPLDGPGLEDRPPHLLLGVIVRHKVPTSNPSSQSGASETRSYTPPLGEHSLTPPLPRVASRPSKQSKKVKVVRAKPKPAAYDGDEPYSPCGSSDVPDFNDPTLDLQKTMDELNKKIAQEKQEILTMSSAMMAGLSTEPDEKNPVDDEAYSPSASFTPPHQPSYPRSCELMASISSDISLPSNIQEILANVMKQKDVKTSLKSDPIVKKYTARREEERAAASKVAAAYVPTAIKAVAGGKAAVPEPSVSKPPVSKPRDPRSQEATKPPTSTLSKLSDAELIEKAAMEMGSAGEAAAGIDAALHPDAALYNQPLPPGVDMPHMSAYPGYPGGGYGLRAPPPDYMHAPPDHYPASQPPGPYRPVMHPMGMHPPPGMQIAGYPPPHHPAYHVPYSGPPPPSYMGGPPPHDMGYGQPYPGPSGDQIGERYSRGGPEGGGSRPQRGDRYGGVRYQGERRGGNWNPRMDDDGNGRRRERSQGSSEGGRRRRSEDTRQRSRQRRLSEEDGSQERGSRQRRVEEEDGRPSRVAGRRRRSRGAKGRRDSTGSETG